VSIIFADFAYALMEPPPPPPHQLGWNLTFGHAKEFAHASKALVTLCPNFGILRNNQHDVNFAPIKHRFPLFKHHG